MVILRKLLHFTKQACDIYVVLGDVQTEGRARNNLANTVIKLKRYDAARDEIKRAIECKNQFGHTAQPWTAFSILYDLEIATGKPKAAEQAWEKEFSAYLSYREDGGYGRSNSVQIVELFKNGMEQGNSSELETMIEQYSNMDIAPDYKHQFSKFISKIKSGS